MDNLGKVFNRLREDGKLAQEIEAAKEKFAFKPFAIAYRSLALICNYCKFPLSAFSVVTGFGCLYFGMVRSLGEFAAAITAVIMLIMIEIVKSYALDVGFTQSYSNGSFSPTILFGLVFTSVSVFLSLKGAASLYRATDASVRELEGNFNRQYDSLINAFDKRIADARSELEAFRKAISWKGKIDMYNKSNALIIKQMNERIALAETDKRKALEAFQARKSDALTELSEQAGFNVTLWVFLSGFNELGILLCLWFSVYYQYRIATDAKIIDESASFTLSINDVHRLLETAMIHNNRTYKLQQINQPSIGFKLGQNKSNENPVNAHTHNVRNTHDAGGTQYVRNAHNASTSHGICAHCGKPFKRKTQWHIYCSEECRITAWEKRTGKKYVPRKK